MRNTIHVERPIHTIQAPQRTSLAILPLPLPRAVCRNRPWFITANVDNDPGGILTYSQAGAKYGYALLWTLVPTTIALIVVQEMAARMGAITGKGLSDRPRGFGLRMTFTMFVLGLADLGNIASEFAGLRQARHIWRQQIRIRPGPPWFRPRLLAGDTNSLSARCWSSPSSTSSHRISAFSRQKD